MIHVVTRRFGPLCIAATTNDYRDIAMSWGFTQEGATQRLIRLLDRAYPSARTEADRG